MKINIFPLKIILYFLVVFLWSSFFWSLSFSYLKSSHKKSLTSLSSSLIKILDKQIHIKMQHYFYLIETLNKIRSLSENSEENLLKLSSLLNGYPEIINAILIIDPNYASKLDKNLTEKKTNFFFKKNFILRYQKFTPMKPLLSQEKFHIRLNFINDKVDSIEIVQIIIEKNYPIGYFALKISTYFLEEIFRDTIEFLSSNVYLNLFSSDHFHIVGTFPANESKYFREKLFSKESENLKIFSFNKDNYLSLRKKISFLNVDSPWYLSILLPFKETIPSYKSLLLFNSINGLIIVFLFLLTIILILWSLRKNKEDTHKVKDFEEKADRDSLTSIYNRSKANKYLKGIQDDYNQKGASFCCILFDIDYFKGVNDSYGHDKGDYVLKKISSLIQMRIRSDDLLARVGGEEFLVVLRSISIEDAYKKAEMLRGLIAQHDFDFSERSITISLGGAFIPQKDLHSPLLASTDALLEIADKALYFSKSHGRNQTTFTIINIQEFNYSLS